MPRYNILMIVTALSNKEPIGKRLSDDMFVTMHHIGSSTFL